jgi:hypothetical protein
VNGNRRWLSLLPVAAVAIIVLAIIALDVRSGGEAKPGPYLGEAKAERYPYVEPTPTPVGLQPTPIPRPTIPGARPGDPNERDAKRRADLLALVGVATDYKRQRGSLPSTNNNVQTLCAYERLDQACAFRELLSPLPLDPLGSPVQNGYWYSSDGARATFYASLEAEIPEEQRCPTEDAELKKRAYVICVQTP